MDYRKTPKDRPWARDLDAGDRLTTDQAAVVCQFRLSQFGLRIFPSRNGFMIGRMSRGGTYFCEVPSLQA